MNCLHCDSAMQTDVVELTGQYRGREVRVHTRGVRCPSCGFVTVRGRDMAEFRRLVKEAYRRDEQLLEVTEIQRARKEMHATQESFAAYLAVGVASVKRLEGGAVPERLMDEHIRMRLYPETLEVLLQERLWDLNSLKGALAELPHISAQCSLVWNGLSDCWNTYDLITTNYDAVVQKAMTTCAERHHSLTEIMITATSEDLGSGNEDSSCAADTQLALAA